MPASPERIPQAEITPDKIVIMHQTALKDL
jgi:hypothetical protein